MNAHFQGIMNINAQYEHQQNRTNSDLLLISMLIKQRTQLPEKCGRNGNNDNNKNNWLPYYSRCDFKSNTKHTAFIQGLRSTQILSHELIYSHIFKAGGTTIQFGIPLLRNHSKISINFQENLTRENIDAFIMNHVDNNTFIFTFVRDPISKFLSAFFEYNERVIVERKKAIFKSVGMEFEQYIKMNNMELVREIFIERMLNNIGSKNDMQTNYVNTHFAPNLLFFHEALSYNFIGNFNEFNTELPRIMQRFIIDEELKHNSTLLMNTYFGHKRSKHRHFNDSISKYVIDRAMLRDNDIQNLCQIYWMDYLCFPFEMPQQCNLTDLIIKHMIKSNDIKYRACY